MNFLESKIKSIDISTPKIDLKTYPEVAVKLSRYQTKSYPYVNSYKIVTLDQQLPLAPKSTRVISIRPPNEFFRKGTSFVIGSELQAQGIYTYNVQSFRKEKELPIMLNNPQNTKVVIHKGPIGHTLEDIEIIQDTEFSVVDNIAFINHLMISDTNWDQIFHVSEKQGPKNSKIQNFFETNKTPEKQKKTEKRKRQQDFTNNFELETDFSDNLKDFKPQLETTDENIRPGELPKEKLNRFDETDQAFLKKFNFSQADINDESVDKLLKTLTKKGRFFSTQIRSWKDKAKISCQTFTKFNFTKQRPSKVPLHYQEKLENLLEQQ